MLFPGEAFDATSVLNIVQEEGGTSVYGVPTMFLALADHPDFASYDVSSLRTGIMAGAPCPIELMKRVVTDLHMPEVSIAYGMTETSPITFQTLPDDPLERRVSTVGRVMPRTEVRIVDESGETTRLGEKGELCARGYLVMRGYWNDDAKTRDAIDADGWMHTGDLATIDDEGYCQIVGRVKDMVIRGGENIYPREIEEFLFTHPKIANVQVFGVPDKVFGEQLCAWIILHEGESASEDEIKDYCKGKIAHFKVPYYVRFRTDLPMTVTGKPQKFVMRDAMVEELGFKS